MPHFSSSSHIYRNSYGVASDKGRNALRNLLWPRSFPVLAMLLIVLLTWGSASNAQNHAQNGAEDTDKLLPVIVERVKAEEISRQLLTSGDVLPSQGADIFPKIAGEIMLMNVKEGSAVNAGDIMAEIDHRILDAQLEQAQAAVTVAQAAVEVQAVLVKSAESSLTSAKAQARAADTQAANSLATRKRFQELFREGAISEQQLDDVNAQYDAAHAQKVSATSAIRQAEDAIQSNQVSLKMKKTQLVQAQANLHAVEVQRENAFVRAPFPGIVTLRAVDAGAMANPGQAIFRLENMTEMKIIGTLVEKDLLLIDPATTKAIVRVDAYEQRTFEGRAIRVFPAIAAKTRTGQFEVLIENRDIVLRSGMYAAITLLLETVQDAVVIPRDAVLSHNGQASVVLVNEEGLAVRTPIRLGIQQGVRVEVLEGLTAGALIITQGAELVKTGVRVRPVEVGAQQ